MSIIALQIPRPQNEKGADPLDRSVYIETEDVPEGWNSFKLQQTGKYDGGVFYISPTSGSSILEEIINENGILNATAKESIDDVRAILREYDSNYDSRVNYVTELQIDEPKNTITHKAMSSNYFFANSKFFDVSNVIPMQYYFDSYTTGDGYIASYATLATEKYLKQKGKDVKINAAYATRSTEDYMESDLPQVMDQIFPIFVIIIYTLPYMYLIQRAVEEKQTKTRESMRMMGMKDSAYFTSWFIVYFFQITIISVIMTLGTYFTVFKKANIAMIFFMFWLYGISTFGL